MGAEPRVIHRFEIPVDDQPHGIDLSGSILHAAVRRPGIVDVWAYARPENVPPMGRAFQVVGTGHPNPTGSSHAATAITPDGALVWHVLEVSCAHQFMAFGDGETPPDICPQCGTAMTVNDEGAWIPA